MVEYKTIGGALAAHVKLEERIAEAGRQLDELKKDRDALNEQIASLLKASGQDSAKAAGRVARWRTTMFTSVEDWDVFHRFVKRTGFWQLMQKRVTQKHCQELVEHRRGKPIPGTKTAEKTEIQVVKAQS